MFKYWKINTIEGSEFAWIYCPEMENKHDISTIRKGYIEFKKLERYISKNFRGWVACTGLINHNIMRFMGKMGAQPFEINLKEDKIWFVKNLRGV